MKFKNNIERAQFFFERTKSKVIFVSHEDIEKFFDNQWKTLRHDFIVHWKTLMMRIGKMPQAVKGRGYKIVNLSFEIPNYGYRKNKNRKYKALQTQCKEASIFTD